MRLTNTPAMTVIAAVLVATITAGCTAGTSAPMTPVPAATSASATDPTGAAGSASAASPGVGPTTTPTVAPVSQARITATPAGGAIGASVLKPILVRASGGTLAKVAVTNPEGKDVTGKLSAERTTWTSGEPLGYGRSYRIDATAKDSSGLVTTSSSAFTTVKPAGVIFPSFKPSPAQKQVGVGHGEKLGELPEGDA